MKKSDFALILTAFLIFDILYNFLFTRPWGYEFPLYFVMILILVFSCWLFYMGLLIKEKDIDFKYLSELNIYYTFILGLIILEVFLSMISWQIDPKNKALILLIAFYMVWGVVCLRLENMLSLKKVFIYMILSIVILAFTLYTITNWLILKGG